MKPLGAVSHRFDKQTKENSTAKYLKIRSYSEKLEVKDTPT